MGLIEEIFDKTCEVMLSVPGIFDISLENPPLLVSARAGLYYVNFRVLPSFPEYYNKQISNLVKRIKAEEFKKIDKVFSTETTGIYFGCRVAPELGVGYVTVLKEEKLYGKGGNIHGVINQGEYAIGVDDMVTTKGTLIKAVNTIRKYGAEVETCFVNFDRRESEEKTDFNTIALAWMDEKFLEKVKATGRFNQRQIEELEKYIYNPLKWSLEWGLNHPNGLKLS